MPNELHGRRSLRPYAALGLLFAVGLCLTVIRCGLMSDNAIALGAAINAADRKGVERLLDEGLDPNTHLAEGWRPLSLAVYHGEVEIAQTLLVAGADVDVRQGRWSGRQGSTPLAFAIGQPQLLELLLGAGADVSAADYLGRTALMKAAREGNEAALSRLVEAGAQLDQRDREGHTALFYAVGYPPGPLHGDPFSIARMLVEHGASPGATTSSGQTALYWAALVGHLPIVRYLIAEGAAADPVASDGTTPLFAAAFAGHPEVARALLAAGASPAPTRSDGVSALDAARHARHNAVVEILEPLVEVR